MKRKKNSRASNRSWLDGRHVVFGEVIEGYDVVEQIEKVDKASDKPIEPVKIAKSGEIPLAGEGTHAEPPIPEEGIHAEL